MKRLAFSLALLCLTLGAAAQVTAGTAKFKVGDQPAWSNPAFDDSAWQTLSLDKDWTMQGIRNPNNFAWYRIHVVIPSSLKKAAVTSGMVLLDLGPVDDADETWFNGQPVGKTGHFPADPEGFSGNWQKPRHYLVSPRQVRWDKDNVIAVRVYNGGDPGGFYQREVRIGEPELANLAELTVGAENGKARIVLTSRTKLSGELRLETTDVLTDTQTGSETRRVRIVPGKETVVTVPIQDGNRLSAIYYDDRFDDLIAGSYSAPYILTPQAPATPRYNGPLVFGVRPGSPVIFRLAFSGDKPMKYAVEGLPAGVKLDPDKGVLSGSVAEAGDYPLVLIARNEKGEARAEFTLKVGAKIALTPPMGWNSWNCWGLSVSQEKVMSSATALINRGLADYGYAYMNIDDAWEAEERAPDGSIVTNEKFPDIKGLADWLHANGLKMGIYSSPGDRTCGGYLGTIGHEQQDAETWNAWGVDYLKYDWCGYSKVFNADPDKSVAAYVRPYLKMQQYLRQQPRDIFYSLCQYGMADVWKWGHAVDANSWRTTGDITDTWASLYNIGFQRQTELYPYAGPGHWNDPDMLVVGKVGWSNSLRDSRLTPDEQYTHISLWALLAANMLIGCDMAQMDDFTFNLLCNNEVNAVNQDILGIQAHRDVEEDGFQIWSRPLADGTLAVGIFNLNDSSAHVDLAGCLAKIGLEDVKNVRDLWRQKDIPASTCIIPSHGVRLLKVRR
ncbi:MAG: alpha-galactosidase [Bacteroidales bacterium]|nr:alpha-galactosidase [Bacteroidales bacterium]